MQRIGLDHQRLKAPLDSTPNSEFPMVIAKFKHPILFYSASTIIPWACWFAAGYVSRITPYEDRYLKIASVLGFAGLLAPVSIACWLISADAELKADFFQRCFRLSGVRPRYLLLACFLMPGSILLAQAVSLLFGYSATQFVITGHFSFSSGIFPVWVMLVLAPILEEMAWHSYGTDCLRRKLNLFWTSIIFALFWGVWHIPLSTIRDYYQSNLVETGWIYGANFLVSIFPFVLLMNWLYYNTRRNILIAIIFHITAGFFNEIFATAPDSKIIQTVLLTMLAGTIVACNKRFFFDRELTADLER